MSSVARNSNEPESQLISRGNLYAPMRKTRVTCATMSSTIAHAPNQCTPRMKRPSAALSVMNFNES